MNAYMMNELLRGMIGEEIAAHWGDNNLQMRLNLSQRKIATIVESYPGGWLTKKTDLTPVDSVITLPNDCSKPLYMEVKSSGQPLGWLGNVRQRRVSRGTVGGLGFDSTHGYSEAYALAKTLEVNVEGYGTEVTLWYEQEITDLITGTASAGALESLTLPDSVNVKRVDDYYNGVELAIVSGTGAGLVTTILDYVAATRICILAEGTADDTSVFGTVSILPTKAEMLIILDATLFALAKPSSSVDKEVWQFYYNERKAAQKTLEEWLETRIKGFSRVAMTRTGL